MEQKRSIRILFPLFIRISRWASFGKICQIIMLVLMSNPINRRVLLVIDRFCSVHTQGPKLGNTEQRSQKFHRTEEVSNPEDRFGFRKGIQGISDPPDRPRKPHLSTHSTRRDRVRLLPSLSPGDGEKPTHPSPGQHSSHK